MNWSVWDMIGDHNHATGRHDTTKLCAKSKEKCKHNTDAPFGLLNKGIPELQQRRRYSSHDDENKLSTFFEK